MVSGVSQIWAEDEQVSRSSLECSGGGVWQLSIIKRSWLPVLYTLQRFILFISDWNLAAWLWLLIPTDDTGLYLKSWQPSCINTVSLIKFTPAFVEHIPRKHSYAGNCSVILVWSMLSCAYGVPQGSFLGPLLFLLDLLPLKRILSTFEGISYHCYADDIELYISFKHEHISKLQVLTMCLHSIEIGWLIRFSS